MSYTSLYGQWITLSRRSANHSDKRLSVMRYEVLSTCYLMEYEGQNLKTSGNCRLWQCHTVGPLMGGFNTFTHYKVTLLGFPDVDAFLCPLRRKRDLWRFIVSSWACSTMFVDWWFGLMIPNHQITATVNVDRISHAMTKGWSGLMLQGLWSEANGDAGKPML